MNDIVKEITAHELIQSGYLQHHEIEPDYSSYPRYIKAIESTCSISNACYDIKFYRVNFPPISRGEGMKSHGISYLHTRSRYKEFNEELIGLENLPRTE